jgi:DNA-binding MarR family transcriptional regulator
VRLTDSGRAEYAALAEAVAATTARLYDGLDPDDLATAHRVLGQVIERARNLP